MAENQERLPSYPLPQVPTMVVAEIGNVHDGSLGNCYHLIDACAAAGVDAVKFQAHIAAAESTDDEQFPKRFSFHPQDRSRSHYWRRMEFDVADMFGLCQRVKSHGLKFILSPFSVAAVERYSHLVDFWKIPSGEADNQALCEAVGRDGKPWILSTGMSTVQEISRALRWLDMESHPHDRERRYLLQCTTEYPTPAEHVGMNWVAQQSRNICYLGGLSDHSGTIYPGIIAAYLGAAMVEVHVCWDKRQFGCDVSSSLTIDELAQMVRGIRFAETMRLSPIDKNKLAEELPDVQVYRQGKRREAVVTRYGTRD